MMPKLIDRLQRYGAAIAPIMAFAVVIFGKRWF
jgi:hypothetical protein